MAWFVHRFAGMASTCKRHPILTKETVRTDGVRRFELRVYCHELDQSVSVERCRECPVCVKIDQAEESPDRAVYCTPRGIDPATVASAGATLNRGVVVVDADLPVRDAVALFVERRLTMLVVVDAAGHTQSVVHESRLLREIQDATRARPGAIRLGWAVTAWEPVSSVASVPVTVRETLPLREALVRMAAAHQRQVLVVDEYGSPIGLLRDVDALHGLRASVDE